MKKTDILTPAGFVLGAVLIGYGIVSGGPFSIFIDIPSIFICVGGSLSALLITYTLDEMKLMAIHYQTGLAVFNQIFHSKILHYHSYSLIPLVVKSIMGIKFH